MSDQWTFVDEIPKGDRSPRASKWRELVAELRLNPGKIADVPCTSAGYAHSVATQLRTGKSGGVEKGELNVAVRHVKGVAHLFVSVNS